MARRAGRVVSVPSTQELAVKSQALLSNRRNREARREELWFTLGYHGRVTQCTASTVDVRLSVIVSTIAAYVAIVVVSLIGIIKLSQGVT